MNIKQHYSNLNICTVIGFPLGYNTTNAKVVEAQTALKDGANEVDMVIKNGDVKNKEHVKIIKENTAIKKAVGDHALKVIIETCYLYDEEKIQICKCVTDSGANYI